MSLVSHAPVIVVDDASTDETAERASRAGAEVIRLSENQGYGGAIDLGMRAALERGYRAVVTADADGQHSPDEVAMFVDILSSGDVDLVVGIRPGPFVFVERICAWYSARALGVKDPLCGLKGYELSFYARYGSFNAKRSVGTELMTYAIRHGARWQQRPIQILYRADGTSRFYRSAWGQLCILRSLWGLISVR